MEPIPRGRGSASELEYHLLRARDLELLNGSDYKQLAGEVTEVKRMLTSFIQKLSAEGCLISWGLRRRVG